MGTLGYTAHTPNAAGSISLPRGFGWDRLGRTLAGAQAASGAGPGSEGDSCHAAP